jgi:hypothetical protein
MRKQEELQISIKMSEKETNELGELGGRNRKSNEINELDRVCPMELPMG